MKRVLGTFLLVMLLAGAAAAQEYNRDVVVQIMRTNASLLGQINASIGRRDFLKAGEGLMTLAQGHLTLLAMNPPKGNKDEWEKINRDVVIAAYKGIGASGAEHVAGLQTAVAELRALSQAGHRAFR